jgi:hypothetical protein
MEPKPKNIREAEETVAESTRKQQLENKRISEEIISSEPRIPDVTGLNTDTTVVNRSIDDEEV